MERVKFIGYTAASQGDRVGFSWLFVGVLTSSSRLQSAAAVTGPESHNPTEGSG